MTRPCERTPGELISQTLFHIIIESDFDSKFIREWSPDDWREARFQSQLHGIAPLLYYRLKSGGVQDILPREFQTYISSQYFLNSARINKFQNLIYQFSRLSAEAEMPVLFLKGSVLIHSYYEEPACRPMADIDILIHPHFASHAGALLQRMGLRFVSETHQHKVYTSENSYFSTRGEHPDNPIIVELHTSVMIRFPDTYIDVTDSLWQAGAEPLIPGSSVFMQSGSGLLFHLTCHAGHNQYQSRLRAIQLYDLVLAGMKNSESNWLKMTDMVEFYGLDRLAYPVLRLGQRLFNLAVPEQALNRLSKGIPNPLKQMSETEPVSQFILANENKAIRFYLNDIKGIKDRWVFFLYRLSIKQMLDVEMKLKWMDPGWNRYRELWKVVFPSPKTLRFQYRKRMDRYPLVIVYLFHWLLMILFIFMRNIGITRRSNRLGRYLRRQYDQGNRDE